MKNLALALLDFQQKMVIVDKTATNPFYHSSYAPLPDIIRTVQPLLNECGLIVTQLPSNIDGTPALTTTLIHAASGESITETTPIVLTKQDPQAQGSAITYMRRYAYASILQIVIDEDDDGNRTVQTQQFTQARTGSEPANQITDEQLKQLTFLGSELDIGKTVARTIWSDLYEKHQIWRGKWNPESKSWEGTKITKNQIPLIVNAFAEHARLTPEETLDHIRTIEES